MQVAAAAPTDREFVAVTNSPLLVPELAAGDRTVKLTGGEFREKTKALTGPTAESYIRASNFDLAFLGVNGIEPDGTLSAPNEAEANLKRLVAANATRTVVVTVSEKFGERSFRRFGTVDDIDVLVTDGRVPDDFRELFAEVELVEDTYG
jgi:DeoR family fructose operon transcriptional repressor